MGMDDCCGYFPPRSEDPSWKAQSRSTTKDALIAAHEAEWNANANKWSYTRSEGDGFLSRKLAAFSSFCVMLRDNFGSRFLVMLTSVYFGVKGFLWTFVTSGMMLYFRSMGVSGVQYQAFNGAAMSPWSMKALWGALTDLMGIGGYHKRSYITGVAGLGTFAFVMLATVKFNISTAKTAVAFFFLAHFELAIVDLLTEGKYAELMSNRPKTGGAIVSYVWGTYQLAGLLGSVIVGPMADAGYVQEMYWLAVPFALQVGLFASFGFFPEVSDGSCFTFNTKLLSEKRKYFILAVIMAAGSIALNVVNLFFPDEWPVVLGTTIALASALCIFSMSMLPRKIAKCNFYMFISSALYVQIPGAIDYFYLAEPACIPDGPHFDNTYYVTWSNVMQSIAGIFGVALFQMLMSDWHFRPVFLLTTILRTFAAIVDIIIVERWNKDIGIPDKAMYMLGFNIIYQVTYMMEFMPGVVLTSKLCPKNIEATVYALLAGFSNFGQAVSNSIGLAMLSIFNIHLHKMKTQDIGNCTQDNITGILCQDDLIYTCNITSGATYGNAFCSSAPCTYEHLATMIFLCHMVMPMFSIPFLYLLIPSMRLTDSVALEGDKAEDEDDQLAKPLVANESFNSDEEDDSDI